MSLSFIFISQIDDLCKGTTCQQNERCDASTGDCVAKGQPNKPCDTESGEDCDIGKTIFSFVVRIR